MSDGVATCGYVLRVQYSPSFAHCTANQLDEFVKIRPPTTNSSATSPAASNEIAVPAIMATEEERKKKSE